MPEHVATARIPHTATEMTTARQLPNNSSWDMPERTALASIQHTTTGDMQHTQLGARNALPLVTRNTSPAVAPVMPRYHALPVEPISRCHWCLARGGWMAQRVQLQVRAVAAAPATHRIVLGAWLNSHGIQSRCIPGWPKLDGAVRVVPARELQ